MKKRDKILTKKTESRKFKDRACWKGLVLLVVVGSFLGGIISFYISEKFLSDKFSDTSGQQQKIISSQTTPIAKTDQTVVQIVKKNSPAVVSIIVTKNVPQFRNFFNDPFFEQFYFGEELKTEEEGKTQQVGAGTGFIVDSKGYIVTNKHVVSDEEADYTVMLSDGQEFKAKVLAKDQMLDVAILKIQEEDLPTINMGDSSKLNIGETVIAIGNSLGELNNTVSKGIISGLKRQVEAGSSFGQTEILDEVVQTDAAINPGNSGGPLLNLKGQAIGINVAMAQGAENIGFTIPINQIKNIYESVRKHGKIIRPYLGIRYIIINEKIQKLNNLKVGYGALIIRGNSRSELAIIPDSPADKAGLKEYDIITEIDDEKITQKNDLAKIIRKKKINQTITLEVLSKGKKKTVQTTLEKLDF